MVLHMDVTITSETFEENRSNFQIKQTSMAKCENPIDKVVEAKF